MNDSIDALETWLAYRAHTGRCSVLYSGAFSHADGLCNCGCHQEER